MYTQMRKYMWAHTGTHTIMRTPLFRRHAPRSIKHMHVVHTGTARHAQAHAQPRDAAHAWLRCHLTPHSREALKISERTKAAFFGWSPLDMDLLRSLTGLATAAFFGWSPLDMDLLRSLTGLATVERRCHLQKGKVSGCEPRQVSVL